MLECGVARSALSAPLRAGVTTPQAFETTFVNSTHTHRKKNPGRIPTLDQPTIAKDELGRKLKNARVGRAAQFELRLRVPTRLPMADSLGLAEPRSGTALNIPARRRVPRLAWDLSAVLVPRCWHVRRWRDTECAVKSFAFLEKQ